MAGFLLIVSLCSPLPLGGRGAGGEGRPVLNRPPLQIDDRRPPLQCGGDFSAGTMGQRQTGWDMSGLLQLGAGFFGLFVEIVKVECEVVKLVGDDQRVGREMVEQRRIEQKGGKEARATPGAALQAVQFLTQPWTQSKFDLIELERSAQCR